MSASHGWIKAARRTVLKPPRRPFTYVYGYLVGHYPLHVAWYSQCQNITVPTQQYCQPGDGRTEKTAAAHKHPGCLWAEMCIHFLRIYKVICNYLHLNADSAQVCLSSFQLNEELHIQQSPHCVDSLYKKSLNTLHKTLHSTLTIHSKHAECHKSLNSQYRCL